ncbi:MAG: flagellar protein FliS, partial [Alphaproteobacteria bacterium]
DPHILISVLLEELLKSMRIFEINLEKQTSDLRLRNKHLARALTIIYGLQSSLNMEKGGEIAENLFRLYEYAKQQLLDSAQTENGRALTVAITSLEEITTTWRVLGIDNNAPRARAGGRP